MKIDENIDGAGLPKILNCPNRTGRAFKVNWGPQGHADTEIWSSNEPFRCLLSWVN